MDALCSHIPVADTYIPPHSEPHVEKHSERQVVEDSSPLLLPQIISIVW